MKNKKIISAYRRVSDRKSKHCPDCLTVKSIDEFYRSKCENDGHAPICKRCSYLRLREWQKKNKQHVKRYAQKYKDEGYREQHNENSLKYAMKPHVRKRRKKYMVEYYKKNKWRWGIKQNKQYAYN